MKTTLQKLGKSLSAMVMPNIGAFIEYNGWASPSNTEK